MFEDAQHMLDMDNNKDWLDKNLELFECELLKDAENVDDMGDGK